MGFSGAIHFQVKFHSKIQDVRIKYMGTQLKHTNSVIMAKAVAIFYLSEEFPNI